MRSYFQKEPVDSIFCEEGANKNTCKGSIQKVQQVKKDACFCMLNNKTAGYQQYIFCPPILLKMLFKKMKTLFPINNFSVYSQKNITIKVEKNFFMN